MLFVKKLFLCLLTLAAFGGCLTTGVVVYYAQDLPEVGLLKSYYPPLTTRVWSRDGVLMAEFFEEDRELVSLEELPDHLINAFISAEDSRFFSHRGLDPGGIFRAAIANLKAGKVVQGGSTITQQVAKRLLLSSERSFKRKIREALISLKMERLLSKEEILHLYLNEIYLGHRAYGVGAAAKVYFGKKASELTLAEAALLAGLPQAPSRYDPYQRMGRALKRRSYVLGRMAGDGYITSAEADDAAAGELVLYGYKNPYWSLAPSFSEHVRRLIQESMGKEGLNAGGYDIVTTMDSKLQAHARKVLRAGLEAVDKRGGYRGPLRKLQGIEVGEAISNDAEKPPVFGEFEGYVAGDVVEAAVRGIAQEGITVERGGHTYLITRGELNWVAGKKGKLDDHFAVGDVVTVRFLEEGGPLAPEFYQRPVADGGLVSVDPGTGEVLAAVGGYSFSGSQFNRAVQAKRQAGSAIKPLIYASAIEQGYTPATLVYDSHIVFDSPELDEKWKPKNYSSRFYGATTLHEALIKSRNIVTIKLLKDMGIRPTISFLKRVGVTSEMSPDLSLALGASEVTLLELTRTYTIFATGGVLKPSTFILSITDRNGEKIEEFSEPEGERVMDRDVAYVINHMMQSVVKSGTGRNVRGLGRPTGGKTGTTNNTRDAWFIGFTPELVTGVWVGRDDGVSLGKKETGGRAAAPIWKDYMSAAVKDRKPGAFPVPSGIEFGKIDGETGLMADGSTDNSFTAAFLAGTLPGQRESVKSLTEQARTQQQSIKNDTDTFSPGSHGTLDVLR